MEGAVRRPGKRTGHEVHFVQYKNVDDQLAALKKGELHIAGLNTGTVAMAVRHCGFVPLCTFGQGGRQFRLHDAASGAGRQPDQDAG